jgi:hypothetical protein
LGQGGASQHGGEFAAHGSVGGSRKRAVLEGIGAQVKQAPVVVELEVMIAGETDERAGLCVVSGVGIEMPEPSLARMPALH